MLDIYLILSSIIAVVSCGSLVWEDIPVNAKLGDTVTIKCRAVVSVPALYFMQIERVQDNGKIRGFTIGINQKLEPEYESTGRYSLVNIEESDTDRYLQLVIKEVRGYDGGMFRCSSADAAEIYMSFFVSTPLDRVYFSSLDQYAQETRVSQSGPMPTIVLKQNQHMGLLCTIQNEDSGMVPQGVISIGENVTDLFDSSLMENTTSVDSAPPGVVNFVRTLRLFHLTSTPDPLWNGQTVTCEGQMPGYEPVTASVKLEVHHGPIFRCTEVDFFAREGQEAVMSCSVFANPKCNVSASWGDSQSLSSPDDVMEGYTLDAQGGVMPGEQVVVLTIASVADYHFTYQYTFHCTNQYGNPQQHVLLKKGDKPGTISSTAPDIRGISLFTMLVAKMFLNV